MGIHWGQKVQGFPFPFIAQIFNNKDKLLATDIETLRERYFVPETITIGPTTPRQKLDQDDSYFERIWNDLKDNYLPTMIKQKPAKILSKELWSEITSVVCIRIEFTVNWPSEIILPIKNTNSSDFRSFSSVKSIAVLPQADVNESVNTVYVYDGNQVYQYQINIKENFLPKSFYLKITDELYSQNKLGLSVLSSMSNFESPEEILVSLYRGKGSYSALKLEIPSSIVLSEENITNENIQDKILLNQKDSLMAEYSEIDGEALFTDTENLYKLFDNGILEYKYLPAKNTQAGDASAAFSQAILFIELRRNLLEDMDIVLTDIKKSDNDNNYEMSFGYKYDGVPIHYSDLNEKLTPPLTIKANAERVLECKWVIRSITGVENPKLYSLYIIDLIEKIPTLFPDTLYPEIVKDKYFKRLEPGYVFGSDEQGDKPIYPNWIISTKSNDYFIPLLEEEG